MTTNFKLYYSLPFAGAHPKDEPCSSPPFCLFAEGAEGELSDPPLALADANFAAEDDEDDGMQRTHTSAFAATGVTGTVTKSVKVMKGTT